MTAEAAYDDPDDPVGILGLLPDEYRAQFFDDYNNAVENARRPEGFRALRETLRLWRLRAEAYSRPGYGDRLAAARRGDPADFVPAARVVSTWTER
jgi:hypothetical protein